MVGNLLGAGVAREAKGGQVSVSEGRELPPDKARVYRAAVRIEWLTIAYMVSAVGLLYLTLRAKLAKFEHPPIGMVSPLGLGPVWLGWLMIAALAWSAIPAMLLGRAKLPLAAELHDKVLYADAKMNRANWLTAGAAIIGVLGIGIGLWWADAAAAIVISLDITRDGLINVRAAAADLMDSRPTRHDDSTTHPLIGDL